MTYQKGHKHSEETKAKQRAGRLGYKMSEASKAKLSKAKKGKPTWSKGKKFSPEYRRKISESHKGEKSSRWKGGISSVNRLIRESVEYKLWREAVFKRDGFKCIWCGLGSGNLNADHIKPFAYYPELRFSIDNGRTLCKPCHLTTDTWGNRKHPIR